MRLGLVFLAAGTAAFTSGPTAVVGPARPGDVSVAVSRGHPTITRPVRLETRPDVVALFGSDLAAFRARAAASLSASVVEEYGPLTTTRAGELGRSSYYRPEDVELYAVAGRRGPSERPDSYAVIAVPVHSVVHADGSVAPPATPADGFPVPGFSTRWGNEEYFNWSYFSVDFGGWFCLPTRGEIRGQWAYARLDVSSSSAYDYWGISARAVAEITHRSSNCENTLDTFQIKTQSLTDSAYAVRQDPRTGSQGACTTRFLAVGARLGGVVGTIRDQVERCETWSVSGALTRSARVWYGIEYDHQGQWHRFQREAAALEIVRVPRGASIGLSTLLDLDVDNR